MSQPRSLLHNVFSYGAISTATVGAMFVLHVAAGRLLGAERYGELSFALALAMMFSPLLDPGLYYLLVREIARRPESATRLLAHALTWKALCAPAFLLLLVSIAWAIHASSVTLAAVALIAASQVLLSLKDAFRPVLLGLERFGLDALSLTVERVSLLAASLLVLLGGHGLIALCVTFLVVRVLDLAVVVAMTRGKVERVGFGRDLRYLGKLLRDAMPIGAFYITLQLYSYVDMVMLSSLRSHEEVGWYAAAYKLYEGPMIAPAIIGTVFMPRLSQLFAHSREGFVPLLRRGLVLVLIAASGITVAGLAVEGPLVELCYGPAYHASILALRILLLGLPFAFTINFLQTVMISIDRQRVVFVAAAAGLGVNVALNLVLIPLHGYLGASVATISVEGLVCIGLVAYVLRMVRRPGFSTPASGPGEPAP